MSTLSLSESTIRPIDALWALFKSQPKTVRKAFAKRLLEEDEDVVTMHQQKLVKQSLTQAIKELREAEENSVELPDARNLFK